MANILTVDDSPSIRQMVLLTLSSAGHKVTQAADGAEGLEIAKKSKFDLVLSDVNMPRLDGISMLAAVRELADYQYTPLLLLTTESTPEMKQKGKEAGATGWIIKPFNPQQLLNTIKKVLE